MGILDQISILRSPATADLKQDQYSTILVQFVARGITKVYYFAFRRLGGSQQHLALQLLVSRLRQPAQLLKPVRI